MTLISSFSSGIEHRAVKTYMERGCGGKVQRSDSSSNDTDRLIDNVRHDAALLVEQRKRYLMVSLPKAGRKQLKITIIEPGQLLPGLSVYYTDKIQHV